MKVCVMAKLSLQKVSEIFYTLYFDYHRAKTRHLGCMNVLVHARICNPVSMRYRSHVFKRFTGTFRCLTRVPLS